MGRGIAGFLAADLAGHGRFPEEGEARGRTPLGVHREEMTGIEPGSAGQGRTAVVVGFALAGRGA
jgi:hypothetical protein